MIDLSLLSSIRAARESEQAFRLETATAKESTLLAVVQLYLQVQQADSRIKAAEARRETAEAVLKQARDFEEAGTASKLDVARAEQQFHFEASTVATATGDRDTLITALLRTIGLPQEPVQLEQPSLALTPVESITPDRPEMKALQSRLRVAELERQRAEQERLPKLAFAGDYGVAGAGPDRSVSTYAVGATLTIPIWTGGRIESDIQAAKVRIEQSKTQLRSLDLQIAQEIRQSEIESNAALLALASAEEAVKAAKTSLELARLRFASGIATNLDTITAQGTLAQAEDNAIRIRYEFFLAKARHAKSTGNIQSFVTAL